MFPVILINIEENIETVVTLQTLHILRNGREDDLQEEKELKLKTNDTKNASLMI